MNSLFCARPRLFQLLFWFFCLMPPTLYAQSDTDGKPHEYAVWAGLTYNIIDFDFEDLSGFTPVFGAELGFKKTGLRLILIAAPLRSDRKSLLSSVKREGINGEIGLALQLAPVGRLSGKASKGYFGLDLRIGRQDYSYVESYNNPQSLRTETKVRVFKLMFRYGWKFSYPRFFVDLGAPLGLQFRKSSRFSPISVPFDYSNTYFVLLPTLAIGYRF